jgi:hypothetical protein
MAMLLRRLLPGLMFCILVSNAFAQYTPTISGANAFWFLGAGVLYDGAGCTTIPPGACYYAQSALTSNPNGAPGSPTWTVQTVPGGGSVSLSCYNCSNPVATATAPSNGCVYDVTLYVSYGGYQSAPFNVVIATPTTTTLVAGYPTDSALGFSGYVSRTAWNLTDSCGSSDAGLDGNEVFGTFVSDYAGNNWGHPTATSEYWSTSLWYDDIGASGWTTPLAEPPQMPLTNVKVFHDTPWRLFAGSQSFGTGVVIRSDTQQFYQDHGRHQ